MNHTLSKRLYFFLPVMVLGLTGCKKFLEQDPDSNRATIRTPEQMSQLLISAYPKANYMTFSEHCPIMQTIR